MSRLLAPVLTATSLVAVPRQAIDNDASYQEIALDGSSVQAETKPFAMVGITWPESEQTVTAKVRVQRDGQWTDWQPMQIEDDHGPDPLVTEGIQRAGTGAGSARLGLLITDAYEVKGGSRQKFQRGRLVYDRRSRQIHRQYGRDL
jgi:hypothetical protein